VAVTAVSVGMAMIAAGIGRVIAMRHGCEHSDSCGWPQDSDSSGRPQVDNRLPLPLPVAPV
jgi:hypothetical protein